MSYDAVGNLTKVDYTNSPDVTLTYDALNRLTNMIDTVGTTRYSYTAFGAVAGEDGPWDSDTVSSAYDNDRRRSGLSLLQPPPRLGRRATATTPFNTQQELPDYEQSMPRRLHCLRSVSSGP